MNFCLLMCFFIFYYLTLRSNCYWQYIHYHMIFTFLFCTNSIFCRLDTAFIIGLRLFSCYFILSAYLLLFNYCRYSNLKSVRSRILSSETQWAPSIRNQRFVSFKTCFVVDFIRVVAMQGWCNVLGSALGKRNTCLK